MTLQPGEVHIWSLNLDHPKYGDDLPGVLSADEIARGQRFHLDLHRRRFLIGRAALRHLLSAYAETAPQALEFAANACGKPSISNPAGSTLRFNFSHSNGAALLAVTRHHEVGVDIEKIQPAPDLLAMARTFFAAGEYAALLELPKQNRPAAFYHFWTAKEAYVKATYVKARRQGLSIALDTFSVPPEPSAHFQLLQSQEGAEELARWTFCSLALLPGYAAALAVESGPLALAHFTFADDFACIPQLA